MRHTTRRTSLCAAALAAACLGLATGAAPPEARGEAPAPPLVERFLREGDLAKGADALLARLDEAPDDDQARFGLGIVRFLQVIEVLGQGLHRHGAEVDGFILMGGLSGGGLGAPLLRLPTPVNPAPEELELPELMEVFRAMQRPLAQADAALAAVDDPTIKLRLPLGRARLDLTGDGKSGRGETLWSVYSFYNRAADRVRVDARALDFWVTFDRADVEWLRGYCRLLLAMTDIVLAYDWRAPFDASAHLFFAKPKQPEPAFEKPTDIVPRALDEVGLLHAMRLPVREPERLASAWKNLKRVVEHSRRFWEFCEAEMDDDHEWIPNPRQTAVSVGARVTPEMLAAWRDFLNEADAILDGRKLAPWGVVSDPEAAWGVNVKRVFHEPRPFDAMLWLHGDGARPYLERGRCSDPAAWERLQRVFGGQFIGFAFWFN